MINYVEVISSVVVLNLKVIDTVAFSLIWKSFINATKLALKVSNVPGICSKSTSIPLEIMMIIFTFVFFWQIIMISMAHG